MAAAATNSSSFPQFSALPSELRNLIWSYALPDKDEPALYFYRKGYWCPTRRVINDSDDLFLEFCHQLQAHVPVAVPLVSVNREARSIALGWVREQGIERRFWEEAKHDVFARPFDPNYDALYVPLDQRYNFCCEPWDRPFEDPLFFDQIYSTWADLTRLALPEAMVRRKTEWIAEAFGWFFPCLKILFIVVDTPPDQQLGDGDVKVQRRWELSSAQGRGRESCRTPWDDDRDFGSSYLVDGERITDAALEERMVETKKLLREALAQDHEGRSFLKDNGEIRFEIWPVFAVRK